MKGNKYFLKDGTMVKTNRPLIVQIGEIVGRNANGYFIVWYSSSPGLPKVTKGMKQADFDVIQGDSE